MNSQKLSKEYTLTVCPHYTGKGLAKWESYCQRLSQLLGEKIVFMPFSSFTEELKKLSQEEFDLYYASPRVLRPLLEKGYVPIAKLKEEREKLLLVTLKGLKERYKIVMVDLPQVYLISFLYLPLSKDFLFVNTFDEVIECLLEEKGHLGLVYEEFYEELSEEVKKRLEVLTTFEYEVRHLLLGKPDIAKKVKEVIFQLEAFSEVTPEDFQKAESLIKSFQLLERIIKSIEYALEILKSDLIGVIAYQDRILYMNEYAQRLTGYEEDYPDPKDLIRGNHLLNRNGVRIYVLGKEITFFSPIFGKDLVKLFIFVDITKKIRIEKAYTILKEVNQLIISVKTEEELFQKITEVLVEKGLAIFAWVGIVGDDGWVVPLAKHGYEEGYLEKVKISINPQHLEGRGPTGTSLREGRIVINPDTRNNPLVGPWRNEMLQRRYLSSVAIPLLKEGKVFATLNLYADEPYFFEEENREILEELKRDLSFALSRFEEIRKAQILYTALDNSYDWVLITDEKGMITYVNKGVERISKYSKEELLGKNPRIFKSGRHPKEFYANLWRTITQGKVFQGTIVNRAKDGSLIFIEQTIIPLVLLGNIKRYISIGKDLTREKILEEELSKTKYYDALTGLYNLEGLRLALMEELKRETKYGLLILLDVLNMHQINTIYGYEVGSQLLRSLAERLKRHGKLVGRVGGDEFCLYVGGLEPEKIPSFLENLYQTLIYEEFLLGKGRIPFDLSLGVSVYPKDGTNLITLYEKAKLAISKARKEKKSALVLYNEELRVKVHKEHTLYQLVKEAILEDRFFFLYQPYISAETLEVAGLESLIRLQKKDGEIISPGEFIEYLELLSDELNLEERSLKKVVEQIKKWRIPIALNITARALERESFVDTILALEDLPANLILEITERNFVTNRERIIEIMKIFNQRGLKVALAIDDFGTGYSALNYLPDIPAKYLKIDLSFVKRIEEDAKIVQMVSAIVRLVNIFGMQAIAEGVETARQVEILKGLGCHYLQGFYFARPLPREEIERVYLSHN